MAENVSKVSRWTSRRFLLAVAGMVVSVLVTVGVVAPAGTDAAVQVIVGAATLVLNVIGYQVTEAAVDKARAANGNGNGNANGDKAATE
jgi:uncharacterized membrane protein